MSLELEFGWDTIHNEFNFGAPQTWVRVRNGVGVKAAYRGYLRGSDFFSVLWQVDTSRCGPGEVKNDAFVHIVKLRVEAPKNDNDPFLNQLKRAVIKALMNSNVREVIREKGYGYKEGNKVSDDNAKRYKSTTVFCVLLSENQSGVSPTDNIMAVHQAIGGAVDEVVQRFSEEQKQHFSR
jgi:hypothetical protein